MISSTSNTESVVQASLPLISQAIANGQVANAEQLFQDLAGSTGDPNLQSLAQQAQTTLGSPTTATSSQNVAQLQSQLKALQVEFPDLSDRIGPMLTQLSGVSSGLSTSGAVTASPQNPIAGLVNQLNSMVASGASPSAIQTMQQQIINVMNAGGASTEQTAMMRCQFQMQQLAASGGSMSDYQNQATSFFGQAIASGVSSSSLALLQAQVMTASSPSAANAVLTQGIANGAFNGVGGAYSGYASNAGGSSPVVASPIVTAPTTPVYTAPTTTYATPTYTSYAPVISPQYGGTNSVLNQGIANGAFSTALTADQQNMLSQAQAAGASGPQLAMMQLQMQMENQQEVLQAIGKIFQMLDQTAKALINDF